MALGRGAQNHPTKPSQIQYHNPADSIISVAITSLLLGVDGK